MTTVVSNWYIMGAELHYWSMLPKSSNPPRGATKGKDSHGREGWFVGNHVRIVAYQSYDTDMWRFTGEDGKTYIAALSTHYNNRNYPAQCINSKQQLVDKLSLIK